MGVVSINYYCCEHCSLMFLRDFRFLRGLGGDVEDTPSSSTLLEVGNNTEGEGPKGTTMSIIILHE